MAYNPATIIRIPASSGGANWQFHGHDRLYFNDCCHCPPVKTDCCEICLPQCLTVMLSPSLGTFTIYFDEVEGIWEGISEGPDCFFFVELKCDCTDEGCVHLNGCGWKMRLACSTDPDAPGTFTDWECATLVHCNKEDGFELQFTINPPPSCSCYSSGTITAFVSLPPEDEDCCPTDCCCPQFETEATQPNTLTLTIDAPGCPEIHGATTTLTNGGASGGHCAFYQSASHAIGNCGSTVSVGWQLRCGSNCVGPCNSCEDFELTMTRSTLNCLVNGGASRSTNADAGCTCFPLDLVFSGFTIDDSGLAPGTCDCCPGGFSVRITETP